MLNNPNKKLQGKQAWKKDGYFNGWKNQVD